jgi:NAD-dependent dihydropyrimidine dehydrogenase PreA subunit
VAAESGSRSSDGESNRCRAEAGTVKPVIDRHRCEGKADCLRVCPYGVFEIARVDDETFRTFPLLVRLKLMFHGRKQAETPRAADCRACALCVAACPEDAIRLVRAI